MGAEKHGKTSRKMQMITKEIGTKILTLIGLGKSGFFHRKYNKPVTDTVTKNDSTIVQYVINL